MPNPRTPNDRLATVDSFDRLVEYLKDDLNWPIKKDDFEDDEDLFYEYSPEELGIDPKNSAKILEIKRLRPLSAKQPWGVFFVKFEPKKLPVVALRRILGKVVLKKRSSSNTGDHPAWSANDLIFTSNYGEKDDRKMALAHFSIPEGGKDLPVLKVIDWESRDSLLRLDDADRTLSTKLAWPDDVDDVNSWRERWRSAFTLENREVINTAKDLSKRLAILARNIREQIKETIAIENEEGPLKALMKAFQESLIHDLDVDGFADTYAQTISYGLLCARMVDPEKKTADDLIANLRSSPFLQEMLQTFLKVGGRVGQAGREGIDFDELGVSEVVTMLDRSNMEAVLRDFGDRKQKEDPVMHFFEGFLKEYDNLERFKRGAFYTPQPVVSYIVRSVHELLQTEFGLEDGLASKETWGDMVKKLPKLKLPTYTNEEGKEVSVSESEPFVQILDPATGTATFIVETIAVIYKHLSEKWEKAGMNEEQRGAAWNEYVPKHLLPRLFAYELMMAPYAIAHMKVGLKLAETGYKFGSKERIRIYLTNALETWANQPDLTGFAPLAHEANAVNEVKREKRFTVVIGNPPYSGISANMSKAIIDLVEPYKSINGTTLGERKIWAQDDYKKFIRFSQLKICSAGCGILGFITNNGFINEPTSRGMRHNLISTFPRISTLDLHGSIKKREVCPDGTPDKNVFDIEQGVAISFLRNFSSIKKGVFHGELWGLRESKYNYLSKNTLQSTTFNPAFPSHEFYLFVPQNEDCKIEFSRLVSVTDIFKSGSNGIQTSRDHVVYGFTKAECRAVIEEFRASEKSISTTALREKYWPGKKVANYAPGDTRGWKLQDARQDLRRDNNWEENFRRTLYRPFDFQSLFYADYMIDWPRKEVMSQMMRPNLSLCVGRAGSAADNQEWNIVFVSNALVDMNMFYRGGNVSYPLRFTSVSDGLVFDRKPRLNFKPPFLKKLSSVLGLSQVSDADLPSKLRPEDIFNYAYAVFHSPGYRKRYSEFLKIDFPRLPLTASLDLFKELSRLGGELVGLHLLESATLEKPRTTFIGSKSQEVEKVSYKEGTVFFDKAQTTGFKGVPENVWNFHIGGYQVCEKWLKDRKGRTLSDDDIAHYHKIIISLQETIRLMGEIDQVIEKHGGWPGAFATTKSTA